MITKKQKFFLNFSFLSSFSLSWTLPLLLLLALTPITPLLDLKIAHYFYDGNQEAFSQNAFFTFLYNYGTYPAWIVAIISFPFLFFTTYRRPALVMILTLAIGSGLIVNGLLKGCWGRPRPTQIVQFGGSQPFRPYYSPPVLPS